MSFQTFSNNDAQSVASEIKVDEQSSALPNELSSSVQTDEQHKVKAVILRTDGSAVEIIYDANPTKSTIKEILGASPTIIVFDDTLKKMRSIVFEFFFLGEWKKIKVVLLRGKYTSFTAPLNKHQLRFPFHSRKFYGDILLVKIFFILFF
ncbi:hypothetical protein RFI_30765 [Reticulomyxa filosa]|uniref:DUF5880 domain-containing protein n=1 Tax=Reticulomyxa filosa TaxID=46433 RepID=X6M0X3_RETFI|nr:hypothetical protein RFI_30765 [Reticulomyxa filosa]|eukprot:ETO06630.1 hypothetical protein RFI_30765 [Reticulomyxa filosa]